MKVGKLCTIGDSSGMVIPRENLQKLGWLKGDHLGQQIIGNQLIVSNLTPHTVRLVRTRKAQGNGTVRSTQRA